MSVRVWNLVWESSRHGGTELLMMLAIADHADARGVAWPSVPTLAKRCRMSDRNANHLLAKLAVSGELEIQRNAGPRGTNLYRVTLAAGKGVKPTSPPEPAQPLKPTSPPHPEVHFTPEAHVTLKPVAAGGEAGSSKPLKPTSPEPSLNRQEPSEEKPPTRVKAKTQKQRQEMPLRDWLDAVQAKGEKAIPADDAVFRYADQIGLPREFLHLAWAEFKARYTAEPVKGEKQKTYTDWRAVFRKAVREGWLKLWFLDGQEFTLTTTGQQAQRVQRAEQQGVAA